MDGLYFYCDRLLRAIDASDAPICISRFENLAIYRSEWAEEILISPAEVANAKYWVSCDITDRIYLVNNAQELKSILSDSKIKDAGDHTMSEAKPSLHVADELEASLIRAAESELNSCKYWAERGSRSESTFLRPKLIIKHQKF